MTVRPHSRMHVDAFWEYSVSAPEVIEVFDITGADDFLAHVALPDMDALRNFVLDRLTVRPEIGHVETQLIFGQAPCTVLELLYE